MTEDSGTSSMEVQLARLQALEPDFIGLTREEAELLATQHGIDLRVVDHDTQALNTDIRSNRITVDVSLGTVSTAVAG